MDKKANFIKFPQNFKFDKTSYGFKIKATGGEFFPNKYIFSFIIPTIVILFIIWGVTLYFLGTKYASIIDSSKELTIYTCIFLAFPLSFPALFYFLLNLTNTKVEYLFSPGGLIINSKKDSMFISKKNITKVYTKKRISGSSDSVDIWYCLMIEFKEAIKVFGVNGKPKTLEAISLFNDYRFKKIEVANYLLEQIYNTIDFKNNENENLKIDNEPAEKVELPKELNYQEIGYGFKIKYRADDFFSNNIFGIANNQYKIIIIIFLLFFAFIGLKIIKYKFVSILQFIYHYFSHIGTVQYIIQIVLFLVVIIYFFRIILLDINAEYLFSPAGITITSIKGLFFIPYNDIKGIYMDKEALSSSSDETVVYYKISLEFKKEIYFKYLNKNKIKSNLFITKDKKVAFYLLQKIKESVNFS